MVCIKNFELSNSCYECAFCVTDASCVALYGEDLFEHFSREFNIDYDSIEELPDNWVCKKCPLIELKNVR